MTEIDKGDWVLLGSLNLVCLVPHSGTNLIGSLGTHQDGKVLRADGQEGREDDLRHDEEEPNPGVPEILIKTLV